MFKTLKMIVKYSRMKKEDDKRRRRYLKLSREELETLPDDALFDALTGGRRQSSSRPEDSLMASIPCQTRKR